jgi:hypothetical protein
VVRAIKYGAARGVLGRRAIVTNRARPMFN